MPRDAAKSRADAWIAENQPRWSDWCATIWDHAETAWREYRSAAFYVDLLRAEGFEVEEGSGGMPTAFCARWSNGQGPVLGGYAEYDAIPGNCQAPVARQQPRAGLSRFAAGHTDPHSALGVGSLIGFLALKHVMEAEGLTGTLVFFGEPAEKVCGSKPFHAAKGYYDGLDAAFSFHPAYMLPLSNTVAWTVHCGANWGKVYTFLCDRPEGWGVNPNAPIPLAHTTARAPGATDALVQMYATSKITRDSMWAHAGAWSLNEAVLIGGQATADNLAPHISQIAYAARAPKSQMLESIFGVLDRNAKAAAEVTHCRVEEGWVSRTRPGLPNHAFARLTWENMAQIGGPVMPEAAKDFAREIQSSLGLAAMDEPFLPEVTDLTDPQEAERGLRAMMQADVDHFTNDDYVEYTWHAPTVRFFIGRPMLAPPKLESGAGYRYPDWAMNALGGFAPAIDPMTAIAGRVIAQTAIDLLTDPAALSAIKAEFDDRTGGGVSGTQWLPPQLDPATPPPIHYRWPEYVETSRGRKWWIGRQPDGIEQPG
ncbi:MAG: amidohydrolase [Paracoccaceae bacterium]|nr:amidohydrolase [Paracoccaceae bacterium]